LPKHNDAPKRSDDARNDEQIALVSFDKRYTVHQSLPRRQEQRAIGISEPERRLGRNRLRTSTARRESLLSEIETLVQNGSS
jgi:hypothetical protein